jgi:hypothetical protein
MRRAAMTSPLTIIVLRSSTMALRAVRKDIALAFSSRRLREEPVPALIAIAMRTAKAAIPERFAFGRVDVRQ